jgi:LuxR family transcriptional regulator
MGKPRIEREGSLKARNARPLPGTLTLAEREVLGMLKEGKPSREIARLLEKTERTVNFHVSNILRKLDAANRTHAVVIAMEKGLFGSNG